MRSPFPGMDPFLEGQAWWPDFHYRFIDCWAVAIAEELPPEYEANLGERVYLAAVEPDKLKLVGPDVSVSRPDIVGPVAAVSATAVALQPVTIPLPMNDGP